MALLGLGMAALSPAPSLAAALPVSADQCVGQSLCYWSGANFSGTFGQRSTSGATSVTVAQSV